MTETKHTRGELKIDEGFITVYGFKVETIGEMWSESKPQDAARLVSGWNLQNRLDEMGVQDALKEIQELRDYIRKLELEKLSHF